MNNDKNKYKDTISKIQASDELKKRIVEKMNQENMKNVNRGGIFMKIRKTIIAVVTTLAILVGSGAVYAAMGGTIFGKPALEWLGIGFSEKYEEYVVPVENQSLKNDKLQLDLISTVSDDGFIVLNYNLKYTDEFVDEVKAKYMAKGWNLEDFANIDVLMPSAISFNDIKFEGQWHQINSSYDTVIIDGKEMVLRGRSEKDIQTIVNGKEYEIYVLYFLADYELEGKDEFTLTLKQPIIKLIDDKAILDSEYLELDGQFNIEVSKAKAIKNSSIIEGKNNEIKIGDFSDKLEKVIETPLQNIIKITNTISNRTLESACTLTDRDYIGEAQYKLFDVNDGRLVPIHQVWANIEYVHKDGTKTKAGPEEGTEIPELIDGDAIVYTTYIVFEKNNENTKLNLNVYSNNEYYDTVKLMGTHNINLNKKEVTTETKNEELKITATQFYRFEDLYNHVTGELMDIDEYEAQFFLDEYELMDEEFEDVVSEYEDDIEIFDHDKGEVFSENNTPLEDEVGAIDLYYNAMELYNDMTGSYFEMSDESDIILAKDGINEVEAHQVLNFDEVADKVFSKNGKKQYANSINTRVTMANGKVYLLDVGRGTDVTYAKTDLILKNKEENRIEYTAKASYANWPSLLTEGYQELTENLDEYTYAEEAFVLVKEKGNWLVEEFTLPN